ncbi:MAG TPA: HEAT repeat domain-containing protein, partial [Chthonomonadaceae bacterium]|nr:HEAT repeat domain-containing protein [Chthonomonadaceae bacterium]
GPAPRLEYRSANARFALRIDEHRQTLTLLRRDSPRQSPVWTVASPIHGGLGIPAAAYIRDDGDSIVLRDQYAELGEGDVLVFLDGRGQVLRSYTLADLFSMSEILAFRHSISSIWWSVPGLFRFANAGDTFGFIVQSGVVGVFDARTGERLPDDSAQAIAFRREAIAVSRADLRGGGVSRGVMVAGVLKDASSVRLLKKLLRDPSYCEQITSNRRGRYYGLQIDAGAALVRILGKAAAPDLEARLESCEPMMAEHWIELLKDAGGAGTSPAIRRYAGNSDPDLRSAAICAQIEYGSVDTVRRNRKWLADPDERVRYAAIRRTAEAGGTQDIPSLRDALNASDSTVRLWSLRGLARLGPPDTDRILRQHIDMPEAHIDLADRGDGKQLAWCVSQLRLYAARSKSAAIDEFDAHGVAVALARHRAAGADAAFARIAHMPAPPYGDAHLMEATGLGGLAALGHQDALLSERKLAAGSEVFTAVEATSWLGICKDRESGPMLRSLLRNREVLIRDAARDALKAMNAPDVEPERTESIRRSNRVTNERHGRKGPFLAAGACAMVCAIVGAVVAARRSRRTRSLRLK